MPTRRQTLAGLLTLAAGGGAITTAALSSSTTPEADLRVVLQTELEIIPERPDEAYVETDEDGRVTEFVLDALDKQAKSAFDDLARIRNLGTITYDEVVFEFEVTDEHGTTTAVTDEVEKALQVISGEIELHGDTGEDTLLAGEDEELAPVHEGDDGLPFGLLINLHSNIGPATISDLPEEDLDIILRITAVRD